MKKLTSRERDILICAIDTAIEKDKCLKTFKDEYEEIKDKLTFELTSNGNRIRRGFSFAGCNGTELDIFSKLRSKGYKEFYYSAPYHWGVVNVKEMKIYTYTEGDIALTECKSLKKFQKELMSHWEFMLENHDSALDGDSVLTMKEAGLTVKHPRK